MDARFDDAAQPPSEPLRTSLRSSCTQPPSPSMLRREPTRLDVKEDLEEEIDEYKRRSMSQPHHLQHRRAAVSTSSSSVPGTFQDGSDTNPRASSQLRPTSSFLRD
ncbi:hypothetical protein, variant 2 [Aphanomyces astaci]|uniref:Uncharacterized protein n=1 Tax=Aphanomyces astaci TaxID=112090 RepID=W4FPA8_APHAT|nr:hypothetical protein H257_14946 [Aphanomyces astaci]XP_009841184.1 hypothetical protein, variant 1 [Aphanomyces astaci]XP_009841185.1 hypothetical protein, variant 2 [Aphanomyces astaci]ETV69326.1 hypothetical protein H257_14946 [Aphanomyces astaci]ETV69327.1 hypothetical protein, variant 1 [Aphanomyces astaci]ETV69328.1 hypothetical protein, variant 2 [Aphanomyces astaci]|eukprot:XP_009841183.1 hypothetical protein H257_14946 [Aphanomyces astaci]